MTIKVNLDIYSGLTEPEWYMPKADIDTIRDKLQNLPSAKPEVVEENLSDLDYRGFILHNIKEPNFPDRVQVINHVIITSEDNKKRYKKDTKGIEELLIKQAIKKGYGEILAKVNHYNVQKSKSIVEHGHEHTVIIQ